MQCRFLEPEVELVTAAVARVRRGLRLAFRTVRRTGDADMKVLGVAIPGPHLGKPLAISSGLAAQRLLDRGIDEDAGDRRILRGNADKLGMRMGPHSGATTSMAEPNSRSSRLCTWSGIGVNQISASRPTWWLVWPESIGPPRGCDMSPTRRPRQPTFFAFLANRSMKRTDADCPNCGYAMAA